MDEIVNSIYVTPHVGASLGRLLEGTLVGRVARWPRFGSSMTSAFFAGFWPTVGPPTVAELTELRAEVAGPHDELAMARVEAEGTCVAQPAESPSERNVKRDAERGMEAG